MTDNPALRARGQDIGITLYDGTATTARGTVGLFETSAGEAGQAFAAAGPIAWLDYAGDPQQIEFVEYEDKASGERQTRRTIKRERVGTVFPTVKLHLSTELTVMAGPDFNGADFSSTDFRTD